MERASLSPAAPQARASPDLAELMGCLWPSKPLDGLVTPRQVQPLEDLWNSESHPGHPGLSHPWLRPQGCMSDLCTLMLAQPRAWAGARRAC